MKRLLLSSGDKTYLLRDLSVFREVEIEALAVKCLSKLYPAYRCFIFGGSFVHDGVTHRPDLALFARDLSHWFVIEVELLSHSLRWHVLPQVTCFRFGVPQSDCASILARELGLHLSHARTLVEYVPRSIAVIADGPNVEWAAALSGSQVQFLHVGQFISDDGDELLELSGQLDVAKESLGFGTYVATDRALRCSARASLPEGPIQVDVGAGSTAIWVVSKTETHTWIVKESGRPNIPDGVYVQVLRTFDGDISFRFQM